eukprot:Gb_36792 [translate_table: standard]
MLYAKMLDKVYLRRSGYKIIKYLFVMSNVHLPKVFGRSDSMDPWIKDSNWMSYVAVSTDEETKHLAIGSFRFVNSGIDCLRMQECMEVPARLPSAVTLTAPLIEDDS